MRFSFATWFRRTLAYLLLIGGMVVFPVLAQTPKKKDNSKPESTKSESTKKESSKSEPTIRLPSGAIIVVTDKLSDALQKTDAIYLSPEKYQELVDQIENLKKQLAVTEKRLPPSECRIEGRTEEKGSQTFVRLKTTFRFKSITPKTLVFLGFLKAQPVDPKLEDGKLPLLISNDEGLSVLIENPGEHTLRMDFETPLSTRGSKGTEFGFEVELPGSPITSLTFALPKNVKRLSALRREVGSTVNETKNYSQEQLQPNTEGLALGGINHLELFWEDSEVVRKDQNRTATSDIQVTISDTELLFETKLRLQGTAKEWKFVAPANAEVSVRRWSPSSEGSNKSTELPFEQSPTIVRPEPNQPPIWRLQFRDAIPLDLLVAIHSRTPRPSGNDSKSRGPYPIGPFAALDVTSQSGTIRVKIPPHLRITPQLKGDTRKREVEDPLSEAVFGYTSLTTNKDNLPGSPVDLDIRIVPGSIQTSTTHRLELVERGWAIRTEIQINPIRVDVDRIEIEIPAAKDFQDAVFLPADIVEGTSILREMTPQRRVMEVKLIAPQRLPFHLQIDAVYPQSTDATEATLTLPRVLNTLHREAQLSVTVPEDREIRGGVRTWLNNKLGTTITPLKIDEQKATITSSRSPIAQLELSWKHYQPHFRMDSIGDVTLTDGWHRVQQRFHCFFYSKPPRKLRFHLTDTEMLRTGFNSSIGTLESLGGDRWQIDLPPDTAKEFTFRFDFAFRVDPKGNKSSDRLRIPYFWAEGAIQSNYRMRFWRDPTSFHPPIPTHPSEGWQPISLEIVPEESHLPLWVVSTQDPSSTLSVELIKESESNPSRSAVQVWIERSLIQVQSGDSVYRFRARYYLRKWFGRQFELDVPGNATELQVFLQGKGIDVSELPRNPNDPGKTFQVAIPIWTGEPLLVEVRYQVPLSSSWSVRFTPPRIRGSSNTSFTRWQIGLPGRLLPLCFNDSAIFEERWSLRNGLPTTVPSRSIAELDRWFMGGIEPSSEMLHWEGPESGCTFRQATLEPVRFWIVPRGLWIIFTSLVVLLIGLILSRLPQPVLWISCTVLAIVVVIISFLWSQFALQTFATSLPGLGSVLLIVGLQRYLQWRYHWRLHHMGSFRLTPSESSLVRIGSNQRPPIRETSTVDSPPDIRVNS
jgi:hypothetical protein